MSYLLWLPSVYLHAASEQNIGGDEGVGTRLTCTSVVPYCTGAPQSLSVSVWLCFFSWSAAVFRAGEERRGGEGRRERRRGGEGRRGGRGKRRREGEERGGEEERREGRRKERRIREVEEGKGEEKIKFDFINTIFLFIFRL